MVSMPCSCPWCLCPVRVPVIYALFVSLLSMPCSRPCCLCPVRVHGVYALFMSIVSMPCSLPFCLGPIHFHFVYALFTSIMSMSCPCPCCLCPENDLHLLEWGWWRDFFWLKGAISVVSVIWSSPSPLKLRNQHGARPVLKFYHLQRGISMGPGHDSAQNIQTSSDSAWVRQAMIQHRTYRLAHIRPGSDMLWFSAEHTD